MGAQVDCLAREKEALSCCLARDSRLTEASLQAAGLECSPKLALGNDFESCWSRETSEAGDVEDLASSSDDSSSWPDCHDAEYDCACCGLTFAPRSGPRGLAILTVAFKADVAVTASGFEEALGLLVEITREHVHTDFITVFDVSKLAVPSAFDIPRFLSLLRAHVPHFQSWREFQQGFAVVQGESALFNTVVSAFGAISRAKSKPIFGKDRAEVLSQLAVAFQ